MISRSVLLLIVVLCIGCKQAADHPPTAARLLLSEKIHNFGDIADTEVVTHIFHVTNGGADSVNILDVHSSCGCTATVLDKKVLAAGDSANLKVTFDPRGKANGKVEKKIWITTNIGQDTLMVRAYITGLHKTMMTVSNIFDGDCRSCHVDKGVGKFGRELYNASCVMCHTAGHAPHLGVMKAKKSADTTYYRLIAHGKPGSNMPAFGERHGGPLTEKQIKSLVTLLTEDPKPPPKAH